MARRQGGGMGTPRARLCRAPLEVDHRPRLARLLRLVHLSTIGTQIRWFGARRHRRQYADHAGPRLASRPGLVRPSPVSAESALRREHPLVAAGRPADRRADPAACGRSSAGRRRSAGRSRSRRCCRICCCSFSLALTARRLIGPTRLSAWRSSRCSSPARPTACSCRSGSITTAGSWRCWRWHCRRSPIPSACAAG